MTFFEQELHKLFDKQDVMTNVRIVGNTCYGKLTDDIRVKINFSTCGVTDHYDALKITLLNRNEGTIDTIQLKFQDLWGTKKVNNPNFQEGIRPHVWVYNAKAEWYIYKPNKTDYQQLADATKTYLEVFQEPVQIQQTGQNMC